MYSFQYEGKTYYVAILNSIEDYMNIDWQDDTIYFISQLQVFILKSYIIAKGNLRDCYTIKTPIHVIDLIDEVRNNQYTKIKTERSEVLKAKPQSEVKKENPEWFIEIERSEISKTADTSETILELSVPSAEELDNYFSSIGLKTLEESF